MHGRLLIRLEEPFMNSFVFSINAVIPVFIIILLGLFLRYKGIIDAQFVSVSQKVVFMIALPALIFASIASTELGEVLDGRLVAFAIGGTLSVFFLTWLVGRYFIPQRQSLGAFIQGVYRSNFAIIGLPIIGSMFGPSGAAKGAIVLSLAMPLFNVLAVIILSVTGPRSGDVDFKSILRNILKNPLIIATVAGIVCALVHVQLPVVAARSIEYLTDISIPLALIGIGGSFSAHSFREKLPLGLAAAVLKIIFFPVVIVSLAVLAGIRGSSLGVLFIFFASPSAVSSYIMAKAMDSDADLAGLIVMLTTLGSVLTIFAGVFVLKGMGVI